MSESDVLDFKSAQYLFSGATEDQKSELVKDILAFANAWKTDDAYIVIGAKENPGGRATLTGVSSHLDDARIQELVNSKTNHPVAFEYVALTFEGVSIAIIRIRRTQQRPIFLRKKFGRLEPNAVYLRRGSSTATAAPDEIARMGAAALSTTQEPILEIDLARYPEQQIHGKVARLTSTVTSIQTIPSPRSRAVHPDRQRLLDSMPQHARVLRASREKLERSARRDPWPPPDPKQVAEYRKKTALLSGLVFRVHNAGRVLVSDARIIMAFAQSPGLSIVDEIPAEPRGGIHQISSVLARSRNAPTTTVRETLQSWEVTADIGKIQPNATSWSAPFWLGSTSPCDLSVTAQVLGDNISTRTEVTLQFEIYVNEESLTIEVDDSD
ncbi:ATP-binding protein [Pendulispora brunnea]|uniref:ATP-binding protein n=1 Tax=Pendulispora brunnea TaxID=2905690 RepID=A0ABZ2KK64_9BACT